MGVHCAAKVALANCEEHPQWTASSLTDAFSAGGSHGELSTGDESVSTR